MPIFLLSIYIGLIFIRPMEWWPPLEGLQLVNLTAIATLVVGFPQMMNALPRLRRELPECSLIFILLLATITSYLPAFWLGGMQFAFQDFGKLVILYLLIVLLAPDARQCNWLLWTLFIGVGFLAFHTLLQHFTGYGVGGLEPLMRRSHWDEDVFIPQAIGFGIFNDPNDLCLVFIAVLPLAWAMARSSMNFAGKVVGLTLIGLSIVGAWATNSRGGFVGLFGMCAAYTIVRAKGLKRWGVISVSILLITVVAPSRVTAKAGIDIGRVNNWGDGIAAFKANPIFGIGYWKFPNICEEFQVAHNSYIHVLTELGLVGYVPFFLLIYFTLLHLRRTINLRAQITPREHIVLAAFFSSLAGYLTAIYFLSRQYTPVLYILLALAMAHVNSTCRRHGLYREVFGSFRQDLKRGVIGALGSVLMIYLTVRIANLSR